MAHKYKHRFVTHTCIAWALVGVAGCGGNADDSQEPSRAAEPGPLYSTGEPFSQRRWAQVAPAESEPATIMATPSDAAVVTAAASTAPALELTAAPSTALAAAPAAPAAPAPAAVASPPAPAPRDAVTTPAIAPAPPTFESQLLSRPALPSSAGVATPPLSAAHAQQVAAISREWAVPALWAHGYGAGSNGVVVPPVQFAWMQGVASAARGASLLQLQGVWPAATAPAPVAAALMSGVARKVSGGLATPVIDSFLSAVALDDAPGTLASFGMTAFNSGVAASDPLLRLDIVDSYTRAGLWERASVFSGYFLSVSQGALIVPMMRVEGAVLAKAGVGYDALGLHLGAGRWLFRITPQQGLSEFGSAGLATSLAEVQASLAAGAAAQEVAGTLVVPVSAVFAGEATDALNGLSHALDRYNADMRGLDGLGGTYLRADKGAAGMTFNERGFSAQSSRSAKFVFEPLNVFNTYGSVYTSATSGSFQFAPVQLPPCPSPQPDLRPSYFAVIDANGRIEVLARLALVEGQRCQ